ncbi:MAG: hypothetical protein M3Y27_04035 [Acidobacteriota bacterium]|nr:hypothetical protein [Acidobacteriota bacterium]
MRHKLILQLYHGLSGFRERIAGLADIHMVQQGGELAYLLLHDPEYRRVRKEHPISHDRIVYVGDGSSDVHAMLHVNRLDGLTIAVSENKFIN